jgi:acyl-CoA thioesterase FadM
VITEDPHAISVRNGHAQCLVCGDESPWRPRLCFQLEGRSTVHAEFRAHSRLQGYDGILHGGVVATLLDAAMTHCMFHNGVQAVTGDMRIRFTRPISCDSTLDIRAWIRSSRPPLYHLRAEIVCGTTTMSWAEAKFMQLEAALKPLPRDNRSVPDGTPSHETPHGIER